MMTADERSTGATIPTYRIAVAFDSIAPDVAVRVSQGAVIEPGARFEVTRCAEEVLPAGELDAVVYATVAEAKRPRALVRLEAECARRGVEVVRIPVSSPDLADEVPRRLRLSRVTEVMGPGLRRSAAPAAQRSFAFDALAGASRVRLPPEGPTVSLTRVEGGVRLEAVGAGRTRSVQLRWGLAGIEVDAVGLARPERDEVPSTLSVRGRSRDVLAQLADAVAGDRGTPRALLEPMVRRARVWLVRALPRHVRVVARPFHAEAQAFVAARVAADPTGRVAQLARVCPGAFLLCANPLMYDAPSDELCQRTIAGQTLPDALAPVLAHWSERLGTAASAARQLRWLRRVGPGVAPDDVILPFPAGLALDDVPARPRENAAWFRAAATLAQLAMVVLEGTVAPLAPFVSARGVALGELDGAARQRLLRRLLVRGQHLGRWPGRRTTLDTALHLVRPWPEHAPGAPRVIALPPFRDPALQVRVLSSAADLAREGEEMHHCVAQYARDVESGDLCAMGLTYRGERLTATVLALDDTLVLDQLSGRANQAPSRAARRAVARWLSRL